VKVSNVSKCYPAHLSPRKMLRYLWPADLPPRADDFRALDDVSFALPQGYALGIVGRNGSGKSTLLQIIAGLLTPSAGRVEVRGRVAALLELGAGFNPEFTGRENILLSGAIYGFSREYMNERYSDIVSFADIGPHLEQPVKTYSSGMFARLAFAVSIQVEPDILIVDEILSVGDIDFRAKCHRKMEEIRERGTSILFATHDLGMVQSMCEVALLLNRGRLETFGSPRQVADAYMDMIRHNATAERRLKRNEIWVSKDSHRAELRAIALLDAQGRPLDHVYAGDSAMVRYKILFNDHVKHAVATMQIRSLMGTVIYDHSTEMAGITLAECKPGDAYEVTFNLSLNLCAGAYRIGAGISEYEQDIPVPLYGVEAATFEVVSEKPSVGFAHLNARVEVKRM